MTDPEVPARDPSAGFAAAARPVRVAAQDPGDRGPRSRRRWPVITFVAVVVVAGLAAGLVAWAPWTPPPVLRPAGLVVGPATANSVSFRWSPPATGPLPDKYLILGNGTVAGTVAGTVTSYRQAGLTPASAYQYHLVAVRGGKRSPPSAPLAVRTLTPPISQARLQGPWDIRAKFIHSVRRSRNWRLVMDFLPACTAGACDATLHVTQGRFSFTMKLARAGARYQGQALAHYYRCGPAGNSIPDPTTLRIRIRVTAAAGEGQAWVATSVAGTMVGIYHYVSTAAFYCAASTFTASLTGTPH